MALSWPPAHVATTAPFVQSYSRTQPSLHPNAMRRPDTGSAAVILDLAKDAAGGRREVGDQDQVWSLSTAKPGNGVEQLRDGDLETYWQCVAYTRAPRVLSC